MEDLDLNPAESSFAEHTKNITTGTEQRFQRMRNSHKSPFFRSDYWVTHVEQSLKSVASRLILIKKHSAGVIKRR